MSIPIKLPRKSYGQFDTQTGVDIVVRHSGLRGEVVIYIQGEFAHLTVDQARRVRDALDAFIAEHAEPGEQG